LKKQAKPLVIRKEKIEGLGGKKKSGKRKGTPAFGILDKFL